MPDNYKERLVVSLTEKALVHIASVPAIIVGRAGQGAKLPMSSTVLFEEERVECGALGDN